MGTSDDADRANFYGNHLETFDCDGVGDRDPMYDDAPSDTCKCGYPDRDCPGCRHCFPPDADAIHTGFERWDCPNFYRLAHELDCSAKLGLCLPSRDDLKRPAWFDRWIGFNPKVLRAAQHKLQTICDESETHPEAVARYEAWAANVRSRICR
jgi:hypothetical protein